MRMYMINPYVDWVLFSLFTVNGSENEEDKS